MRYSANAKSDGERVVGVANAGDKRVAVGGQDGRLRLATAFAYGRFGWIRRGRVRYDGDREQRDR